MRQLHCACLVDRKASGDQLRGRSLHTLDRPALKLRALRGHQRASGNREQSEQRRRIWARVAQACVEELRSVRLGPAVANDRRQPERRAGRLRPQCLRVGARERRHEADRELDPLLAPESAELQDLHRSRRQAAGRRVDELIRSDGRTRRGHKDDSTWRLARSAQEVVAESDRKPVGPVQIVEDDQGRPQGRERAMRGFEDTQRFDRAVRDRALEHELSKPPSVLSRTGERQQQRRDSSEGHVVVGSIAGEANLMLDLRSLCDLGEQPGLPRPGRTSHERDRSRAMTAADDFQEGLKLLQATDERTCHASTVLRRSHYVHGARRSSAAERGSSPMIGRRKPS